MSWLALRGAVLVSVLGVFAAAQSKAPDSTEGSRVLCPADSTPAEKLEWVFNSLYFDSESPAAIKFHLLEEQNIYVASSSGKNGRKAVPFFTTARAYGPNNPRNPDPYNQNQKDYGIVVFSQHLLALTGGDCDKMAFALAHEISHITTGHIKQVGDRLYMFTLSGASDEEIKKQTAQEQPPLELEADDAALALMAKTGYNPCAAAALLKRVAKESNYDICHGDAAQRIANTEKNIRRALSYLKAKKRAIPQGCGEFLD